MVDKSSSSIATTDLSVDIQTRRKVESQSRLFSDYKIIKVIGAGTFGKVYLSLLDKVPVALKSLQKSRVIDLKQTEHVMYEKNLLAQTKHAFIVNLQNFNPQSLYRIETFKNETHLFLAFEYVQGGEIFRLLRKEQQFPNDVALFYITEIVLALSHLHKHKIVYRDLKPENLLIASDGHIKLTDFGFAKRVEDKTYTLCGTPEYLAPEIIISCGYNSSVDWWALGILLFEMLVGYPPFYDTNPMNIYKKIVDGHFDYPRHVSHTSRKLINALLEPNVEVRLGCSNVGAEEVQGNTWFKGVDWEQVELKEVPPPWVPELAGQMDSSYFEDYPDSYSKIGSLSSDQQKLFEDF